MISALVSVLMVLSPEGVVTAPQDHRLSVIASEGPEATQVGSARIAPIDGPLALGGGSGEPIVAAGEISHAPDGATTLDLTVCRPTAPGCEVLVQPRLEAAPGQSAGFFVAGPAVSVTVRMTPAH